MNSEPLNRESLHVEASEASNDSTIQLFNDSNAPRPAWQPFTPKGLAAFSTTTFGRVFLLLCVTALIGAGTFVWFLHTAWYPAIRAAIHELPAQGQIIHQELNTPRVSSEPLAEHRFLGFVVLIGDARETDLNSHIGVKFRKKGVDVCSLFGCWRLAYPPGWTIEFNRTDLEPGWGAWEPVVTVIAALGTFLGLLIIWFALGSLYCLAPWIVARVHKRHLTLAGSWRMCSASVVPGTFLLVAAIWLYGLGVLDLLQFFVLAIVHIILAWLCIVFAWRALPGATPKSILNNPFAASSSEQSSSFR